MPQRGVLLAVVASFVSVVGILGFGTAWLDREAALDRAESSARNLVQLLERHAEATLDIADLILGYLAHEISAGVAPERLSQRLRDWGHAEDFAESVPPLGTIWVFAPDGRLLFASTEGPSAPPDLPELSYFATPGVATDGVVIGRLRDAPQGAFFTISKGVRMADGVGIVTAAVSAAAFRDFYRAFEVGTRSFVVLMHRDGAVIATPWPSRLVMRPLPSDMITAEADGLRWVGSGSQAFVLAWRQIRDGPLLVLAALSKADALESWRASLRRNGIFGMAAMVILAAITAVALTSLRREEESRARLDRALSEKEMLFRELHHRVKNNLQVVTSLITMQSLRFPQPELQETFRQTMDRVRAMGLVHELLYQQERSERLDFGNYLRALIATLAASHGAEARGIEVTCQASAGAVELNLAIPAALIVNELLTNALKYAFPEGRSGHIHIVFTHRDDSCGLSVTDDGIGFTASGPARGTGVGTLIVRSLAAQLSADYSVDSGAAGTRVSLTFPCPA